MDLLPPYLQVAASRDTRLKGKGEGKELDSMIHTVKCVTYYFVPCQFFPYKLVSFSENKLLECIMDLYSTSRTDFPIWVLRIFFFPYMGTQNFSTKNL